ncbi:MAG TPA: response regulator [Candidatus Limnocylindria bacterium]|nr:response regulator [Candidatus Limnocylindria bacterium]
MAAPLEILIVDDSPTDRLITAEALEQSSIANRLHFAQDGVEAMEFLRKEGPHRNAPRPDMILLDLNMPRKDGREVLADVKTDPALQLIPVVVLTTSCDHRDIRQCYALHANCYIAKPVDFKDFTTIVQRLEEFWFAVVKLPPP